MEKRRHRFKQTTTLAQRLTEEASRLRKRARDLSPGPEQAQVWRKIRQLETALRVDAWLTFPRDTPPGEIAPFMGDRRQHPADRPDA